MSWTIQWSVRAIAVICGCEKERTPKDMLNVVGVEPDQ